MTVEEPQLRLERHLVDIGDACLEVFVGGRQGGPVVCMNHPIIDETPEPPWLAEFAYCVRVNLRGQGTSSPIKTRRDATKKQGAADLEAVRRALGLAPWVFMGSSAGGFLGLLYAVHQPQGLRALVLGTCYATNREAIGLGGTLGRGIFVPTADGRLACVFPPDDGRSLRSWASLEEEANVDLREELRGVRVPVLVRCGAHDGLIPLPCCQELGVLMPNATVLTLEHSGHTVSDEDRERYRAAVRGFLADLATP